MGAHVRPSADEPRDHPQHHSDGRIGAIPRPPMTGTDRDGRVLILSRELPPAVGPHPIRVAKLTKYLPEFGWQPTVLTVPLDHAWALDVTLADALGGTPVIRVPRLLRGLIAPNSRGERSVAGASPSAANESATPPWRRLVTRLAAGLLVPDRDLLWAVPAARAAARLAGDFDVIMTTAPPFSTHLAGAWAGGRTATPWVAEYRDNWTMNPHYRRGPVRGWIEREAERRVLRRAAVVIAISEPAASEIATAIPSVADRIMVAANGFDPDDMPRPSGLPSRFEIVYAGTLDGRRDPRPLLTALANRMRDDATFASVVSLRLIGNVAPWVAAAARDALGANRVRVDGLLPHREALEAAAGAAVLLGITTHAEAGGAGLTSKLFEYLGLRRPILMLAPAGPARTLVTTLEAGETAEPDDPEGISSAVGRLYDRWRHGTERIVPADALEGLTRRETARRVAVALGAARLGSRDASRVRVGSTGAGGSQGDADDRP